jgi:heptosyltransferase-2
MYGNAKRWPPERFARIADWAAEYWQAHVLTLGSGNEMVICEKISDMTNHAIHNFCGNTTLEEAVGIIALCKLFLTNDSGLMHIAAALGVPTLAVFGSTDHVATGPMGDRTSIIRHDFECAPCLKTECPIDHRCMLSIEPEEVWEEMKKMKEQSA